MNKYLFAIALWFSIAPVVAAPDEEMLGKLKGYPVPTTQYNELEDQYKVGGYSHTDSVYESHKIKRGDRSEDLPRAEPASQIYYSFKGVSYPIQDYLNHQRTTSLLVVKDGVVLFEKYEYDRKDSQRMLSQSMAKSITSLLVGIALDEGKIKSLDDTAEQYVSDLKGTAVGKSSIRNLLRMSSGTNWKTAVGEAGSDNLRLTQETYFQKGHGGASALQWVRESVAPGSRFNYSNADTFTLALVVGAATNNTLANYASKKLWQPLGAEADASWIVDRSGAEVGFSGFNAIARDYARVGIMLANDGLVGGKQIISRDYLRDATDPAMQPDYLKPKVATNYLGYGYQFWTFPLRTRTFAMFGIVGQGVFVQPESKIVMVVTSVWKDISGKANDAASERTALWMGVLKSLDGKFDPY